MDTGAIITILVLAGVMAAIFVAVLLVTRRMGAGAEARADDLRGEVERLGEGWLIPLRGASYQGARHTYSTVRANGVLGLTGRRVVFEPISGQRLSLPLARLASARLEDRQRDALSSHRHRLVLILDDENEVRFHVDEPSLWAKALAGAGVGVTGA